MSLPRLLSGVILAFAFRPAVAVPPSLQQAAGALDTAPEVVIYPAREIVTLASGRPVIAYAAGGALDYVEDGVTGTLFHQQTPEALADAIDVAWLFAIFNRLAEGLGWDVPPDDSGFWAASAQRLHDKGYR